MIRNETEYKRAVARLREEKHRYADHEKELRAKGLSAEETKRVMDPLLSFHLQLREEVESYERLKNGHVDELRNLHGVGRFLIGLRIAMNLTQKEFASRLGISETQLSRDERNEYHGITVDRVSRILDALQIQLTSIVKEPIVIQDHIADEETASIGK